MRLKDPRLTDGVRDEQLVRLRCMASRPPRHRWGMLSCKGSANVWCGGDQGTSKGQVSTWSSSSGEKQCAAQLESLPVVETCDAVGFKHRSHVSSSVHCCSGCPLSRRLRICRVLCYLPHQHLLCLLRFLCRSLPCILLLLHLRRGVSVYAMPHTGHGKIRHDMRISVMSDDTIIY